MKLKSNEKRKSEIDESIISPNIEPLQSEIEYSELEKFGEKGFIWKKKKIIV